VSECGAGIAKPGSQAIIATVFGNYTVNVLTGLNDSNQVRHSLTLCCVCLLCTDLCECVCVCVCVWQDSYYSKLLAIGLVIALTSLNCYGVKETSTVVTHALTHSHAHTSTN
jgi:amino acid transporter